MGDEVIRMALVNPQKRPFLAASTTFASAFFGRTAEMQQVRREVELLSQTDLPVLIHGESGTGKSFVAELLQRQSRLPGRLFRVDCMSTDATSLLNSSIGLSSTNAELNDLLQHGGTLVLESIEDLDAGTQPLLLLFLKREVANAAADSPTVRIVSTCTQDLQQLAETGRFRRDLLYHINAVRLDLIPLRQRPEDIRGLIEYYLERYSREALRPRPVLSEDAQELLESYTWPGNLRQLDNLLRSFVSMGSEEVITRELLGNRPESRSQWNLDAIDLSRPVALKEITRQITQDVEREIILKVLQANGWNRQKTARWLQISYRSLLYKLNDLAEIRDVRLQPVLQGKLRAANG